MRLGGVVCDQNYAIIRVMAQLVCPGLVRCSRERCRDGRWAERGASCKTQPPPPVIPTPDPNRVAVGDHPPTGARAVVGPASTATRGGYYTDETRHQLPV